MQGRLCFVTMLNCCMVTACWPSQIDYWLVIDAYKIAYHIFLLVCLLSHCATHSAPGTHNLKQRQFQGQKCLLPLSSATHKSDWQQWCSWSRNTSLSLKVACSWPGGGDSEWSVDSVITVDHHEYGCCTDIIHTMKHLYFNTAWLIPLV